MSVLSKPYFHSTPLAFTYLEKILWGKEGPICPHCGIVGNATKLQGASTRPGLWKCKEKPCRKQFTVTVGTVFESRHIPLPKMLQAAYLLSCSKKGCSSHQLHRILGITYKSAWFLSHRMREAMRDGSLPPMGGAGEIVTQTRPTSPRGPPQDFSCDEALARARHVPGYMVSSASGETDMMDVRGRELTNVQFDRLKRAAKNPEIRATTEIWLKGFHHFTPTQREFYKALGFWPLPYDGSDEITMTFQQQPK